MKIFFILCLALSYNVRAQRIEEYKLHAAETGQDYTISIKKPENFARQKAYTVAFVADGSLGLGRYVLGKGVKRQATVPDDCVIVAVKHTGRKRKDRNRDFIPADVRRNGTLSFGQAKAFYRFVKNSLLPFADSLLPNATGKALIGHSLGGLFCLYAALQEENLFDHYFAISP